MVSLFFFFFEVYELMVLWSQLDLFQSQVGAEYEFWD